MELIGDPKTWAAALQPIVDQLESKAADAVDALPQKLVEALDGMTITITIKKP
jgi:predicted Zn-dependent protease with MMP-like domain